MKTLPTFSQGGILSAKTLTALSQNIMRSNLAMGKGVLSGLELSKGKGLHVEVSAGEFQASAHDACPGFSVKLPKNSVRFLWIEANDQEGAVPDHQLTPTAEEFATNYVCLGKITTADAVKEISDEGRQSFGWKLKP